MSIFRNIKRIFQCEPEQMAPDALIRCAVFSTAGEAYIAQSWLIDNGIAAMVENEGEIYSPQVKEGIGVMAFYKDLDAARRLLTNFNTPEQL